MSTLMLRLTAPLQSWGSDAKFERRGTERVPTKSGVIGMIAAALGRKRHEDVTDLFGLRFGVRVDREGTLVRDFHTARRDRVAYVTYRYYVADAVFLVGLQGTEGELRIIDDALHRPAYPLFLGRRCCPPEGRISLGIRSGKPLLNALLEEPMLTAEKVGSHVRIVYDSASDEPFAYLQRDLPLSFSSEHRKYGFRRVSETTIKNGADERHSAESVTDHDPFMELGE